MWFLSLPHLSRWTRRDLRHLDWTRPLSISTKLEYPQMPFNAHSLSIPVATAFKGKNHPRKTWITCWLSMQLAHPPSTRLGADVCLYNLTWVLYCDGQGGPIVPICYNVPILYDSYLCVTTWQSSSDCRQMVKPDKAWGLWWIGLWVRHRVMHDTVNRLPKGVSENLGESPQPLVYHQYLPSKLRLQHV